MKNKVPKSLRKFIRREKARIRQEVLDTKKQQELVNKLYPVRKPVKQNEDNKNKS
jgi:hypothetical protein